MRCKACDSRLKPSEIIWDEDTSSHEELCRKCREELATDDEDLVIVYEQELTYEGDALYINDIE